MSFLIILVIVDCIVAEKTLQKHCNFITKCNVSAFLVYDGGVTKRLRLTAKKGAMVKHAKIMTNDAFPFGRHIVEVEFGSIVESEYGNFKEIYVRAVNGFPFVEANGGFHIVDGDTVFHNDMQWYKYARVLMTERVRKAYFEWLHAEEVEAYADWQQEKEDLLKTI